MAYNLIAYGRSEQSPQALILAAEIIGTTPIKAGEDDQFQQEQGQQAADVEAAEVSPAALLAEADRMADDENVRALAQSVERRLAERSRGEIDGPRQLSGGVGPNGNATWNGVFRGGELASVTVAGYGDADLDLYIYDDRGNLIVQDTSPDFNPTCTWTPIYTGKFTMQIVNCSPNSAGYRLFHN